MYRGGGDIHQAMLAQERKKEQGTLSPREGWCSSRGWLVVEALCFAASSLV